MGRTRSRIIDCIAIAAAALLLVCDGDAVAAGVSTKDAVRLLQQASFGPNSQSIARVKQLGIPGYLSEQLSAPMTPYPLLEFWPSSRPDTCTADCARDNYSYYQLQKHFFTNALYGQDQLRQRVAFALGQILVTSSSDVTLPAWMRTYQQLLYGSAFGNFRQLLYDVTLSPAMGRFLDMVNNRCQTRVPNDVAICRGGTSFAPNENYAREIQQLFSVGTFSLNQDGTDKTDAQGNPIFTYTQHDITEFARVFTGWALAPALPPPAAAGTTDPVPNYRDPMVPRLDSQGREVGHDRGDKILLNGKQIGVGTDAADEIALAMDNLAFHPNTAPFISKQLIQHLVTSNPSPAYVKRVANVFTANRNAGNQLALVIKAILLDREARQVPNPSRQPNYGKLNEPILFMANLLRAFNAASDGILANLTIGGSPIGAAAMGEDVFRAASVFSFYPSDYEVPGEAGILGPAFGIFNTRTALNRANFVNRIVFGAIPAALPDRPTGTSIDLAPWTALAVNPAKLVSELSCLLLACSMSTTMQTQIINAVDAVPATDTLLRAQTAIHLVATSGQFSVQR
jgi:uncharacterized protein (DUF1800 family)